MRLELRIGAPFLISSHSPTFILCFVIYNIVIHFVSLCSGPKTASLLRSVSKTPLHGHVENVEKRLHRALARTSMFRTIHSGSRYPKAPM